MFWCSVLKRDLEMLETIVWALRRSIVRRPKASDFADHCHFMIRQFCFTTKTINSKSPTITLSCCIPLKRKCLWSSWKRRFVPLEILRVQRNQSVKFKALNLGILVRKSHRETASMIAKLSRPLFYHPTHWDKKFKLQTFLKV